MTQLTMRDHWRAVHIQDGSTRKGTWQEISELDKRIWKIEPAQVSMPAPTSHNPQISSPHVLVSCKGIWGIAGTWWMPIRGIEDLNSDYRPPLCTAPNCERI